MKIVVTTRPFCELDKTPINLLAKHGVELILPPEGRKFNKTEYANAVREAEILIAGTELLNNESLGHAKNLKLIARLGIGLDNVDFNFTNSKNILVTSTPDAPTLAVAELTLGLMLNLARMIGEADQRIKNGLWNRFIGIQISKRKIGIIGLGRVGKTLVKLLSPFDCEIFVNDINPDYDFIKKNNLNFVEKSEIYNNCDFITLHIPLTKKTINLIGENEFSMMREDAFLVNTSRGGIVNELDLEKALENKKIAGAALDVFSEEPYNVDKKSVLATFSNVILTAHMGSCSKEARVLMEVAAVESVIDYIEGRVPRRLVSEDQSC